MTKAKRVAVRVLSLVMLFVMIGGGVPSAFLIKSSAATVQETLGSTSVEHDLESAGFNLALYQKNPAADPQVMMVSELAYTEEGSQYENAFYILVYLYNPSGKALDLGKENTVNFSVGGSSFENQKLVCFGRSANNLFYRFYIEYEEAFLSSAREYSAENEGKRTYTIASVQLFDGEEERLRDYAVGKAYTFTGYAKGCGPGAELVSTLTSSYTGIDTISLELNHTTWRNRVYDASNGGFEEEGVCDAVSTVFFGVPEKYIYDYAGGLKQITSEWYEYKTAPIFVTWDGARADELRPWLGQTMGAPNVVYGTPSGPIVGGDRFYEADHTDFSFSKYNHLTCRVLWKDETTFGSYAYYKYGASFNPKAQAWINENYPNIFDSIKPWSTKDLAFYQHTSNAGITGSFTIVDEGILPKMSWLLSIGTPKSFDEAKISSERLEEYMRWYTTNVNAASPVHGFSSDLFEASIDADRLHLLKDSEEKRGLISQTVSSDDTYSTIVDADISWWQKLWGESAYEELEFSPLCVFTINDILFVEGLDSSSESDIQLFEERYLVENDNTSASSKNVLKELQTMIAADEVPVLYRFAVTEYSVYNAIFDDTDEHYTDKGLVYDAVFANNGENPGINGYVAQETVFLDFDVISLGFDTGKVGASLVIIPVIADPINVISGLIAPNDVPVEKTDWFLLLLGLLVLIVILVLVWPFISPLIMLVGSTIGIGVKAIASFVLKIAWWALRLPFRLLSLPFKRR